MIYSPRTFMKLLPACLGAALAALAPSWGWTASENYNVILVGWDTLRADRVGALGYRGATTPNLDALAGKGCLFRKAVSPSNWTLPSFMSWFTSLYPHQHLITNKFRVSAGEQPELQSHALSRDIQTLPEVLRAHGYRTAGFTGGAGVSGEFGFARGFDVYKDSGNFMGFGTTVPQALEWLQANSAKKFFLFVHGYDCHPQFELPPGRALGPVSATEVAEFQERHPRYRMAGIEGKPLGARPQDPALWSRIYDEKLRAADRDFGRLLRAVETSPRLKARTILIVASDHGEELFDHGQVDHGMTLYDEVIRVPLLVYVPGAAPRVVDEQVRTLDLLPTVLDLLGLKPSPKLRRQMQGRSLAAHLRGHGESREAFSETDYLLRVRLRSLRRADGWKLVLNQLDGLRSLFDLKADPGEKRDLLDAEPRRAYELENRLDLWAEETGTRD